MPEPPTTLHRHVLPRLARATLARALGLAADRTARAREPLERAEPRGRPHRPGRLDQPGATFVTLKRHGTLRGCIGSLEARRALRRDVEENALAAAFRDPRFPPLVACEWDGLALSVSVLSPSRRVAFEDEESLLAGLRPGRDGLILERDGRRGTFLPQVWSQLPDPVDFLRHLERKAGLPPGAAADGLTRVARFEVEVHDEDVEP